MTPTIGIVADDLTGAADTGVAFLASGLSTVVTWPAFMLDRPNATADVLAIDTGSRALDVEGARAITTRVVSGLRERGVTTIYKKIDSLLRGHVGDEVRATLMAWRPGSLAIVAPAFPATGRTTVDGHQHSQGVRVDAPHLPDLLGQAGVLTRLIRVTSVRGGALERALRERVGHEIQAVVCDAETDDDLRAIARAGASLGSDVVWVGSGGLAHAIAAEGGSSERTSHLLLPLANGPILTVVGSRSDIASAQVAEMVAAGIPHVRVPVRALDRESPLEGPGLIAEVDRHLTAAHDVLLTIDSGPGQRQGDDPGLTARLGVLLKPCAARVGGLILTGGDTAVGVLNAWGATAIRLVEEIDPGVVLSVIVSPWPMPIVTKSGSFGRRDALVRARGRMRRGF